MEKLAILLCLFGFLLIPAPFVMALFGDPALSWAVFKTAPIGAGMILVGGILLLLTKRKG
jgi:hypothetical protein